MGNGAVIIGVVAVIIILIAVNYFGETTMTDILPIIWVLILVINFGALILQHFGILPLTPNNY